MMFFFMIILIAVYFVISVMSTNFGVV